MSLPPAVSADVRASNACGDVLARLSLRAAARGIREGAFSAEALMSSYLARIRRHEHRIRAWAWIDEDRALASARAADEALRGGRGEGLLHGVPIGVKDIIHTRGIPTRMGSPIYADFVPAESAACVQALERAGAFVQGKTVTTEFATQHPGPTANPWNPSCTPGGSSSGSAAAVAARFTAAALGTQTRGSVIRPAAYCGVVGFKPSYGVISCAGVLELSRTLDHVGVLARSIDDAALLAHALVGTQPCDGATVAGLPGRLNALHDLAAPPRLAAVRSPSWDLAEAAQRALFEMNCAALQAGGARVEDVDLPPGFLRAAEVTRTIQLAEIAHNFGTLADARGDTMSSTFRELCAQGAAISSDRYREALEVRANLCESIGTVFAEFDAIVTPPAAGEALQTLKSTGDAAFCSIWTLCGLPCIAFPTGTGPRSLPMGLQVVGAFLNDVRTLEIAQWCSRQLTFHHAPEL